MDLESIPDSQSDDAVGIVTWETVEQERRLSTRKAKQLHKLQKELTPLTKEFKEIPRLRTRSSNFQKNNQFTVVAAEFLNLSSKSELNRLFEEGYTKDQIEQLLENKYQEKKQFYTELGIKNHKFKRKNFESWRSMSNSHAVTTNTFASEEELLNVMEKSQQLRLKRINNQPLSSFKGLAPTNNTENLRKHKNLRETGSTLGHDEMSLINLTSDRNNSITIQSSPIRLRNEQTLTQDDLHEDNDDSVNRSDRNSAALSFASGSTGENNKPKPEDDIPLTFSQLDKIFAIQDENIPNNTLPMPYSDEVDTHRSEIRKITDKSPDTEINVRQFSGIQIPSIPSSPQSTHTSIPKTPVLFTRHLRHRNIINRNPYLVDRAEYLGLSTRYELISLEEEGKDDSKIIEFLDERYQQKREDRKKKDVGYGPFLKKSFHEIMNEGRSELLPETKIENSKSTNDVDSDFSIEDDIVEEEDEDEEEHDLFSFSGEVSIDSQPINEEIFERTELLTAQKLKQKPLPKRTRKFSSATLLTKSVRSSSKGVKRPPSSIIGEAYNTENKDIKEFLQTGKTTNSKEYGSMADCSNPVDSDPYSMKFLTLSDDDLDFPENVFGEQPSAVTEDISSARKNHQSDLKKAATIVKTRDVKSFKNSLSVTNKKKRLLEHPQEQNTTEKHSGRKKKKRQTNIVAASFPPKDNPNYLFVRRPLTENYQVEGLQAHVIQSDKTVNTAEFNIDYARGTHENPMNKTTIETKEVENYYDRLVKTWNKFKTSKSKNERFLKYILNVRLDDYKTIPWPTKLVNSSLVQQILGSSEFYYRNKSIKIELSNSSFTFEMPLKDGDSFSKIKSIFSLLFGYITNEKVRKSGLKQVRKLLIHLLMVVSNVKVDIPHIIEYIVMEINSFCNLLKISKEVNPLVLITTLPYFCLYLRVLQRDSTENCHSFAHTEDWLCKRIVLNICSVSFEEMFVHKKNIVLESIYIFLKVVKNPWRFVGSYLPHKSCNILNVTNFLFLCNAFQKVEMDWEYYLNILGKYSDGQLTSNNDTYSMKCLFLSILKINKDLSWEFENQLIVKMFRLLAEHKFSNIGCVNSPKATIYPTAFVSDSLTYDDGCLDVYLKTLGKFTQQYMGENTKKIVERLIPIRSTFGYDAIQLQNRAIVLLFMIRLFDQDLMPILESVVSDMIRNGTEYSIKSAISLLSVIVKQTSRKQYLTVRKFLPHIIHKINKDKNDREMVGCLKDLILNVTELLNGHDISYLKRILDFFSIILKFKNLSTENGMLITYLKTFSIMKRQFEFSYGIEITEKDQARIDKSLYDVIVSVKPIILNDRMTIDIKKFYIKVWLFCSAMSKKPVMQIVFTEWNFLGTQEFRDKMESYFYTELIENFQVEPVKYEVLAFFFKHLPIRSADLSIVFDSLKNSGILPIKGDDNTSNAKYIFMNDRTRITIRCLECLFKRLDISVRKTLLEIFIKSLKSQSIDFSSRRYIKEVALFIHGMVDMKLELTEWDHLVKEFNLENTPQKLSTRVQLYDTVEDICVLFEKSYTVAIASSSLDKLMTEFEALDFVHHSESLLVESFCSIILFHIKEVCLSKTKHLFHLSNWLEIFEKYLHNTNQQFDILPVLNVLLFLGKPKKHFADIKKYDYYYMKILLSNFKILLWCLYCFAGFSDSCIIKAKMGDFVYLDEPFLKCHASDRDITLPCDVEQRIKNLYKSSQGVLDSKIQMFGDEEGLLLMREQVQLHRETIHAIEKKM